MNNGRQFSKRLLHTVSGPRVYMKKIIMPLQANQQRYDLEERSLLENNYVIGLAVKRGGSTFQGKNLASDTVFNSAYLTIREGTTDIIEYLPFSLIDQFNQQGKLFDISMGRINLSNSSIWIDNNAAIVANEIITLDFFYVKKAKEQRSHGL